jgi:hypothetical protein
MTDRFFLRINQLTETRKRMYFIGFFIVLLVTFKAFINLSDNNFQIYSYGSLDFWSGINPYINWNHLSLLGKPLDFFLYSPLFSILFTPFTLLPGWLGVFCWNIFTYNLFYFSVFTLPEQFCFVKKKFIFFYSFLLLMNTLLSVQFNPVVAALFLFSFTLLEKGKGFWAVLLILLSGFTKVYGIFQIGMLLFYPELRKNIFYTFLLGIVFLLLPLVKIPVSGLIMYYQSWVKVLMNHPIPIRFDVIYRPIYAFWNSVEPIMGIISLGLLTALFSLSLFKLKLFKESFPHRVQFLGIIMIWAILLGTSSEKNTYVIAMVGYAMWYLTSSPTKTDKILLWINFVLLEIIPIDIIFPKQISGFLLNTLNLGIIFFVITWGIMVYKTFSSSITPKNLILQHSSLL